MRNGRALLCFLLSAGFATAWGGYSLDGRKKRPASEPRWEGGPTPRYTLGRSGPPRAFPVKLAGKVTNRFNWDTARDSPLEDRHFTFTDAQIEATYRPSDRFQAVAGEWIQEGKARPYNIYANFTSDHLGLRIGNQIVRWGKSDEQSPLDNLNPEDLRLGLTRDRADRKIPVPMAKLDVHSDAVSVQGIYIPYFTPSEIQLYGSDWALFGHLERRYGPLPVALEERPKTLRDAAGGVKISGSLWRVDLAFSYLSRYRDLPTLRGFAVAPPPSPGRSPTLEDMVQWAVVSGQKIRLRYVREEVWGAEFETVLGDLGLRGDVAYVSSQSYISAALTEVRKPELRYLVGVDYNGPAKSYLNVAVQQIFIQNFDPTLAPLHPRTTQLSGELRFEMFGGHVRPTFRGFYDFADKSYYQNPAVTVYYIPNVTLETGVDLYGGPPSSAAGFYDAADQAYLTIRFFF